VYITGLKCGASPAFSGCGGASLVQPAADLGAHQADLAAAGGEPTGVELAHDGPVQVERRTTGVAQLGVRQRQVHTEPGPDQPHLTYRGGDDEARHEADREGLGPLRGAELFRSLTPA
jgi:hypothetical protein